MGNSEVRFLHTLSHSQAISEMAIGFSFVNFRG